MEAEEDGRVQRVHVFLIPGEEGRGLEEEEEEEGLTHYADALTPTRCLCR